MRDIYEQLRVGDTVRAYANTTEDGLYNRLQAIRDVSGAQFRVHGHDDAKFTVTRVK